MGLTKILIRMTLNVENPSMIYKLVNLMKKRLFRLTLENIPIEINLMKKHLTEDMMMVIVFKVLSCIHYVLQMHHLFQTHQLMIGRGLIPIL